MPKVDHCKTMIVGSDDKCDKCTIEYSVSTDKKNCKPLVDHCKIMREGYKNECEHCLLEYNKATNN